MLYKKAKEDNKKTILEDIGVMKVTQELVALRGKMWVLIPTSLTLMVQRSTQHHQSTALRLTHQNSSMVRRSTVQL